MFRKNKKESLLDGMPIYDMAQDKLWIDGCLFENYQANRTFEITEVRI